MKTSLFIPVTVIFLALATRQCEKSSANNKTPVATATVEEILTANSWKLDEIRFLQNNSPFYYKRRVTSDPYSFNTETIKFNRDKTGIYSAGGIEYRVTWDFDNPEKTRIRYIVNYTTPLTVTWENIVLTESSLRYTEYYNRRGQHSLAVATRIP